MDGTWTSRAHLLADAIREPGFACAALNASVWSARVHPGATRGLIGAAMTLTSNDAAAALWAAADPCPADMALLEAAAELEGWTAQLLRHASQMAQACRADLQAAYARASAAAAVLASDASPDAKAAAETERSAAMAAIADCEAALEIIDETGTRLAHAANCLRKVPDDLASVYEVPYQHRREAGPLPLDGEFLTAGISYEAA